MIYCMPLHFCLTSNKLTSKKLQSVRWNSIETDPWNWLFLNEVLALLIILVTKSCYIKNFCSQVLLWWEYLLHAYVCIRHSILYSLSDDCESMNLWVTVKQSPSLLLINIALLLRTSSTVMRSKITQYLWRFHMLHLFLVNKNGLWVHARLRLDPTQVLSFSQFFWRLVRKFHEDLPSFV